jgi:hypothetical protein
VSNAKIAVQKAAVAEAFLGGYEYLDEAGDAVQSEAVTLTDGCGNEVIGPKPPDKSIPVVVATQRSKLHLGHETPVSDEAVIVLAKNHRRVTGLVQNTGNANIRVGPAGVGPTTGYRLVPNQTIIYYEPHVDKDDIWAVREGAVDSVAFGQEETARHHDDHHDDDDDDHGHHKKHHHHEPD